MTDRHDHNLFYLDFRLSIILRMVSSFTGTKVNLCAIWVCKKSLYVLSQELDIADASSIPIETKYVLHL